MSKPLVIRTTPNGLQSPECKILVGDEPLGQLVQRIEVILDATDMLPIVKITTIPGGVDIVLDKFKLDVTDGTPDSQFTLAN